MSLFAINNLIRINYISVFLYFSHIGKRTLGRPRKRWAQNSSLRSCNSPLGLILIGMINQVLCVYVSRVKLRVPQSA